MARKPKFISDNPPENLEMPETRSLDWQRPQIKIWQESKALSGPREDRRRPKSERDVENEMVGSRLVRVCKPFMRRFDPDPRLQSFQQLGLDRNFSAKLLWFYFTNQYSD
jgi:hypothetical protein